MLEENESDQVANTGDAGDNVDIPFEITTRRYTFGAPGIKKIRNAEVSIVMPAGSQAIITPSLEDPDSIGAPLTVDYSTASDPLVRFRVSRHGRGVQYDILFSGGRPELRNITTEAFSDMRSTISRS